MKRWSLVVVVVASAMVLGACGARRRSVTVVTPTRIDPTDVRIEGDHVTIDDHINFATNSDEILDESATILDHLAQFLANHQADIATLHVIGHTDAQGGREHNQRLSERRASAVVRALQERGVEIPLEARGRGMEERLCTDDDEQCHRRNRRVELVIVRGS